MTFTDIKRVLIGPPFPNSQEIEERLDKVRALAIFASDPISSNAYATEAIMNVLIVMGTGALSLTLPLALGVAGLVLLVAFSYVQTILHYPDGGGAYTVAKDNLGRYPSLMAGAALLIDYILTVSVSISAGVRAVTSAVPELLDYRVDIALVAIALITWVNLRGVRESGTVFALPTYAFVVGVWVVIIVGLVRYFELFGASPLPIHPEPIEAEGTFVGFAYIWVLLRAFAGGCTALTGIEAISNGVQAFKPPEPKNAAKTMVAMGVIAMSLFIGITFLATHMELVPEESESIVSQMTRSVTGGGVMYYWVQIFTAAILFLAANTGYQDFPRLASFLARDGFLPRWMQNRGDRLVYSSGILVLAGLSSLIVIIFEADEIAMLPLYALGVMLCFSLSQAGMSRLMSRIGQLKPGEVLHTKETTVHHEDSWRAKWAINIVGTFVTALVFIILVVTKFAEGAWIVAIAIPLLVLMFHVIHRHYEQIAAGLSMAKLEESDLREIAEVAVVPIADIHRGSLLALQYARRISTDVRALCIVTSPEMRERVEARWKRFPNVTEGAELVLINYDYRDIINALVEYIEVINKEEFPDKYITVVVPEFVSDPAWGNFLHNRTAVLLRGRLRSQEDIIVIEVPFHIERSGGGIV